MENNLRAPSPEEFNADWFRSPRLSWTKRQANQNREQLRSEHPYWFG
jgi:hypothetical protein